MEAKEIQEGNKLSNNPRKRRIRKISIWVKLYVWLFPKRSGIEIVNITTWMKKLKK